MSIALKGLSRQLVAYGGSQILSRRSGPPFDFPITGALYIKSVKVIRFLNFMLYAKRIR